MTVTITDEDYQELMRVKREYEKFKSYFEVKLADLKFCVDLNTDDDGLSICFNREIRLSAEIAEIEELLK